VAHARAAQIYAQMLAIVCHHDFIKYKKHQMVKTQIILLFYFTPPFFFLFFFFFFLRATYKAGVYCPSRWARCLNLLG